jgi:hypothetical protein
VADSASLKRDAMRYAGSRTRLVISSKRRQDEGQQRGCWNGDAQWTLVWYGGVGVGCIERSDSTTFAWLRLLSLTSRTCPLLVHLHVDYIIPVVSDLHAIRA